MNWRVAMDKVHPVWLVIIGFVLGWIFAHQEAAKECTKLGAFYVGDQVFSCAVFITQ